MEARDYFWIGLGMLAIWAGMACAYKRAKVIEQERREHLFDNGAW